MKLIVAVVLALVAVACAIDEPIPILRSDFQQQPNGPYEFGFEAGNGIIRQETGELKDALDEDNKPHPVITVRGSYTYPDENGKPLVITYSADENGYHAEGDAIPKLPARR